MSRWTCAGAVVTAWVLTQGDGALADTIHVPEDYPTIQAGIDAANHGDEVIVADGVWTGDGNRDLLVDQRIVLRSAGGPSSCVIDCENAGRGISIEAEIHLVGLTIRNGRAMRQLPGGNAGGGIFCVANAEIINCVITDCRTSTGIESDGGPGGGIYASGAILTLDGCRIERNASGAGGIWGEPWERGGSGGAGGGICVVDGALFMNDCTLTDNQAGEGGQARGGHGGGLYASQSDLDLQRCRFEDNVAGDGDEWYTDAWSWDSEDGGSGAGIWSRGGERRFVECTWTGNRAGSGAHGGSGGGVFLSDGSAWFTRCAFEQNRTGDGRSWGSLAWSTGGSGGAGGGIHVEGAAVSLLACTIVRNQAGLGGSTDQGESGPGGGGGGVSSSGPSLVMTDCTIIGNAAGDGGDGSWGIAGDGGWGGGVVTWSDASFRNCLLAGNRFGQGGECLGCGVGSPGEGAGIRAFELPVVLVNCTLANHEYWAIAFGGTVRVSNSIVMDSYLDPDFHDITYSDIEGVGSTGLGNIDEDPMFVDRAGGDFRLRAGSPCIDAASNEEVPDDITTDLDGYARFVDDPGTEDTGHGDPPIVDMGAYEFQGASCPADLDGSGVVDFGDVLPILAAWGEFGRPEDLDGSGVVDFGDILLVLAAWGPCPG